MASGKTKQFELDRNNAVTFHLSEDARRLIIELQAEEEGMTKTGVNGLIDALKKMREKMVR
jgi:hypothetical protein